MSLDSNVSDLAAAMAAQVKALKMGGSTLYTQKTIKSGDTITASTVGTTETAFASTYTVPANTFVVGDTLTLIGSGVFTSSAVSGPSQRPRIRFGPSATALTSRATLIDAGVQMLVLGATNNIYRFVCQFTVRAIGTSGSLECTGELRFSGASGVVSTVSAGPTGAGVGATPVTVDTTVANVLSVTDLYSGSTAGNSNTLRQLTASIARAGSASS